MGMDRKLFHSTTSWHHCIGTQKLSGRSFGSVRYDNIESWMVALHFLALLQWNHSLHTKRIMCAVCVARCHHRQRKQLLPMTHPCSLMAQRRRRNKSMIELPLCAAPHHCFKGDGGATAWWSSWWCMTTAEHQNHQWCMHALLLSEETFFDLNK